MPDLPARTVAVALPPETHAALEALAAIAGEPVEAVAAAILADAAHLGAPADLRAAARLAAQVADALADRWQQRSAALRRIRADLLRAAESIAQLAAEA